MTTKRALTIGGAVVLGLIALLIAAVLLREPHPGDQDGDGRYQYVTWGEPGADGAPTTIALFAGSERRDYDWVTVDVEADGEKLGMFGSTAPDPVESAFAGLMGEEPITTWDLSTFPPGTRFVFTTRYEDASKSEVDTETFESVRPSE